MKKVIISALEKVIKEDLHLLQVDANERSLTHRLAIYLEEILHNYHVDCEYNRNLLVGKTVPPWVTRLEELVEEFDKLNTSEKRKSKIKELIENGVSVYPDIIVHHRGTKDNFIVIEAKKSTNESGDDEEKLKVYKNGLNYKYAYKVIFPVKDDLKNYNLDELVKEIK